MTKLIVDEATSEKLAGASGWVELFDRNGKLIGFFTPAGLQEYEDCPVSDEELERRSREGGGRTLQEILRDLEKTG